MCFFPYLIPLLQLSFLLMLFAYKILHFGVRAYLPFKILPSLLLRQALEPSQEWLFMYPLICLHKLLFFLVFLTGSI